MFCVGLVMLSEVVVVCVEVINLVSFIFDLKKWCSIMKSYEDGGFVYYVILFIDGLW